MARPNGRPPKPIEERRRTGTGHRPIPKAGSLVPLPALRAGETVEPMRPLALTGRAMWERLWRAGAVWLSPGVDAETMLVVCEQIDEREGLRRLVAEHPEAWRERAQLRSLTADILDGLGSLGFNPVDRTRLGVAEVQPASKLDELMQRRQGRS